MTLKPEYEQSRSSVVAATEVEVGPMGFMMEVPLTANEGVPESAQFTDQSTLKEPVIVSADHSPKTLRRFLMVVGASCVASAFAGIVVWIIARNRMSQLVPLLSSFNFCPASNPNSCGCANLLQADYRGTTSVTQTGKTCQPWDSQWPHSHTTTDWFYPDSGLDSNYCRNPNGEARAWCYTTDWSSRWEYCDVPACIESFSEPMLSLPSAECSSSDPDMCGCEEVLQADYRGTVAVTETGKVCQPWASQWPHSHTRTPENYPEFGLEVNYCRNPDGEARAWCYTTTFDSRWEYCDVLTCDEDRRLIRKRL